MAGWLSPSRGVGASPDSLRETHIPSWRLEATRPHELFGARRSATPPREEAFPSVRLREMTQRHLLQLPS